MPKIEQVLELDPPGELRFKGPFTEVTTSYLTLSNPSYKHVCFKVKTTAPKTYCVRPNSGVLEPKDSVVVAVMLQPFDIDAADKSKHKFMVQTMFAPDGEFNQDTLWRDAAPENLMNSKLRCVFDIPKDPVQNDVESTEVKEDKENLTSKSSSETFTVFAAKTNLETEVKKIIDIEAKKILDTNRKLKEELNQVQQENSRLKEEGLRLRVSRSSGFSPELQHTGFQPSFQLDRQQTSPLAFVRQPQFLIIALIIFITGIYLGGYVV